MFWTWKARARFAPRGRTRVSPSAQCCCCSHISPFRPNPATKASKVTHRPTLTYSCEKVQKQPRRLSERIRNRRNCARLEGIWNMDFQRQIEIELFEIRWSPLCDPGVVVGNVAHVLLQ